MQADEVYIYGPEQFRALAAPRRRIWFLIYTAAPQGHDQ